MQGASLKERKRKEREEGESGGEKGIEEKRDSSLGKGNEEKVEGNIREAPPAADG